MPAEDRQGGALIFVLIGGRQWFDRWMFPRHLLAASRRRNIVQLSPIQPSDGDGTRYCLNFRSLATLHGAVFQK
jgi:hypothetical protein